MQPFELTILGSSSATPTSQRHPTSQLLNVQDQLFLIDCGEGTQVQLRKYKIKFQRIEHIFISHLHGDHYFGLIGLLSSMHLLGRQSELHLYCPEPLKEIIELQNKHSQTRFNFPIHFHFVDPTQNKVIYDGKHVTVETIPLKHRIPCSGFLFREKRRKLNVLKDQLQKYNIPNSAIPSIKDGSDYSGIDGKIVPNSELTHQPLPPRSYAYCSDTIYNEAIVPQINKVDLLYHETTFLRDLESRAKETYHSTSEGAARIATMAEVDKLLIGHFSARYANLEPFLEEATKIFANTSLAREGEVFKVL